MPIFEYQCAECKHEWEVLVMSHQSAFPEPEECPACKNKSIKKMITAPAVISTEGKNVLRNFPDPHPPLQELRGKTKPGCTGGYEDLPEFKPTERVKNKDGNWEWREKKKQIYDLAKK